MNDHVARLVAPIVTFVYCLSFSVDELTLFLHGWRTRSWRATGGTVLHSATGAWIGRGSSWYVTIVYRYVVGETEYRGSHLGYSGWPSGWSDDLPTTGEHVRVWYDPFQPSSAVLRPGVAFANYLGVTLAVAALALATWWLRYSVGAA